MKFAIVRRIKCYGGKNCTKSIFICVANTNMSTLPTLRNMKKNLMENV